MTVPKVAMPKVEFFFDCSSPWTYLAFTGIQPILKKLSITPEWRPILVGGVFNAVNRAVYENRENPNPRRQKYTDKDLQDWFDYYGLTLKFPTVFPVNSAKAMRGALVALEYNCLVAYADSVFKAYWSDSVDISQEAPLISIAGNLGINPDEFSAKINHADYKAALRANTDELIDREGFGSPTVFINQTDMYFGNDRLMLVEHRLTELIAGSVEN